MQVDIEQEDPQSWLHWIKILFRSLLRGMWIFGVYKTVLKQDLQWTIKISNDINRNHEWDMYACSDCEVPCPYFYDAQTTVSVISTH